MVKQVKDYYLWENFAKTCDRVFKPIKQNSEIKLKKQPIKTVEKLVLIEAQTTFSTAVTTPSDLELNIYKKIKTHKIIIERRIDLHGYTLQQSYDVLFSFLAKAYEDQIRYVLIIMGKGANQQGVLQINIPKWLRIGQLAQYVNAVSKASQNHGGTGALYVRIRKNNKIKL